MKDKEAKILIQKFLTNTADEGDTEELKHWLENKENKELFISMVHTDYVADYNLSEFKMGQTKNRLLEKIKADKKWRNQQRFNSLLKYAAILIVFLGLGYFFQNEIKISQGQNKLIPANDAITLELEDGTIEILSNGSTKEVMGAEGKIVAVQHDEIITYNEGEGKVEELVYNTLRIPYGKRFNLELSDGTQVYLNAGSFIKYPVRFLSTGERSVEIVGEAFFSVTSDPNRPFIVNAEKLNVQVLGTEFNVAAYPEDPLTEVVLVKGKVALYPDSTSVQEAVALSPGLKGAYTRRNKEIETEEVNVNVYTSWKNGELVFRNLPFNSILKKLERHYNVQIINQNKDLGKEIFNASFNEGEIENVLKYFDETFDINYVIKNNTIIIR